MPVTREALAHALDVVTQPPAEGESQRYQEALATLDAAARSDEASVDAQLRHFLQNRSYTKAAEHLQTSGPQHGEPTGS